MNDQFEKYFSFAVLIVIIVLALYFSFFGGWGGCEDCSGFWEGDVGIIVVR